jgi:hypothetical protein
LWQCVCEFLALILVSFLIASPIAYYLFEKWLNGFAYRIDIGMMTIVLSVLFITVIALVTVGYQSIQRRGTNPVKILRRRVVRLSGIEGCTIFNGTRERKSGLPFLCFA